MTMNKYTIVYLYSWMSGSHRHTLPAYYTFELDDFKEEQLKEHIKFVVNYVESTLGESIYVFKGEPLDL